ncbi:YggU family protein [Candidatus Woesearchaeota archaeon]|nr:YggU family protein [Candidatus Woesearchaeota archaeon]
MVEISQYISNGILRVLAKPNAPKTEVIGYDEARKALRIAIAAVPDKDRANTELLKFLKKQTGKRCELIAGSRSREKKIRFE